MTSKFNSLIDLKETAHALLVRNYSRVYRSLLMVMNTSQDPRDWYIDERADPHLFYSLLAFAQPEIFKQIYKKHNQCITVLTDGIKYIYNSPIECDDALKLLDLQDDPNDMPYGEIYREVRKELAEDDTVYIEEHKDDLNNSTLLHRMDRHQNWLIHEDDDILTQRVVFKKMISRYS